MQNQNVENTMNKTNYKLCAELKSELSGTIEKSIMYLFDSLSKEIINNLLILEMNNKITELYNKSENCINEENAEKLSWEIDQILLQGISDIKVVTEKIVNSTDRKILEVYS